MATGSGLDSQLMAALESTWGTAATPTKTYEFNSESLSWEPTWLEPTGLRVGTKYKRASRVVQSRQSVSGSIELEHSTRGMGTWWKAALGSTVTTPTLVLGTAHKQVHNPGDFLGKSLTLQVGRPEPSGTVRPHTYAGCKIQSWEFSVSDNEVATLSLDVDGRSEATATALATAAYTAGAEVFNFSQVTVFKTGGTVAGATELTVTGGVTVPGVARGITIKGEAPKATERYGLGNVGLKSEQLENDIPMVTGSIEAEWDRATWYTPFTSNTTTAIELKLEGSVISGTDKNTIHIVIPAAKFKASPFQVGGPDIVTGSVDFEAYADETNSPLMVKLISPDSAAL